jgi:mannose/cellobiose epimerase-like protein (N-acyl-D-glucosamine 2-epimerase family)
VGVVQEGTFGTKPPDPPPRPSPTRGEGEEGATPHAIARGAKAGLRWLVDHAWPLSLAHGVDWQRGAFHEHLDAASLKCHAPFRRLRVAARQTYVFSVAARYGVPRAKEAVALGLDFLRGPARLAEGGFAWRFDLDNRPIDRTRDLYDHAFVLLAFAAAADVVGADRVRKDAVDLVEHIAREFVHPAGGYCESVPASVSGLPGPPPYPPLRPHPNPPPLAGEGRVGAAAEGKQGGAHHRNRLLPISIASLSDRSHEHAVSAGNSRSAAQPRRQNPHMHLFEALLAASEAFGSEGFFSFASDLAALFATRFFQAKDGALPEYLDEALAPLREAGRFATEPGHHYEWIWLLDRFEAAAAAMGRPVDPSLRSAAEALFDFAERHGVDPSSGLVVNGLWSDGTISDGAFRLWPQTERLKAVARRRPDRLPEVLQALERHFAGLRPGLWIERMDAGGQPIAEPAPATSLYHLTAALTDDAVLGLAG